MVGECATYTKEWKDLSKSERAAAGDLGLDKNTWMRGVSPSLNYGGSPTTPFSFLGCELYAKGTDSDDAKVAALKKLKDKSIHSVAAAVAAGYTLTEAGKAGFEVKTACNAIVALYGDDGLYSLGMLWNVRREAHRSARPPPLSPPSPPPVPPPRTTPTAPAARRAPAAAAENYGRGHEGGAVVPRPYRVLVGGAGPPPHAQGVEEPEREAEGRAEGDPRHRRDRHARLHDGDVERPPREQAELRRLRPRVRPVLAARGAGGGAVRRPDRLVRAGRERRVRRRPARRPLLVRPRRDAEGPADRGGLHADDVGHDAREPDLLGGDDGRPQEAPRLCHLARVRRRPPSPRPPLRAAAAAAAARPHPLPPPPPRTPSRPLLLAATRWRRGTRGSTTRTRSRSSS
jgi:hypothetical protein